MTQVVGVVAAELVPVLELVGEILGGRAETAAGAGRLEVLDELGEAGGSGERREQRGDGRSDRDDWHGGYYPAVDRGFAQAGRNVEAEARIDEETRLRAGSFRSSGLPHSNGDEEPGGGEAGE